MVNEYMDVGKDEAASSFTVHNKAPEQKSTTGLHTIGSAVIAGVGLLATLAAAGVRYRKDGGAHAGFYKTLGVGILITLLLWAAFFGATNTPDIQNTTDSVTRMDELSMVMSAYFGPKWKYMSMIHVGSLLIMLVLLYYATKEPIVLNIDPAAERRLKIGFTLLGFTLAFLAVAVVVAARYFTALKKCQTLHNNFPRTANPNDVDSTAQPQNDKSVWIVAGGLLGVLFTAFVTVAMWTRHGIRTQQN